MPRLLIPILVIVVIAALLAASRFVPTEPKISGFIEADEVRVGSRVGGRIAEVLVAEGQQVSAGQVLLRLDPYDLLQRLAEANAQLAMRQAELDKLTAGLRPEEVAQAKARVDRLSATVAKLVAGPRPEEIAAARSRLTLAKAQIERAKRSFDRLQALYNQDPGSISREELDRAIEDYKVAEATQRVREEELQLLERGTREEEKDEARAQLEEASQAYLMAKKGYREEEIAEAQAAVAAARAAVEAVEVQLRELEIRSDVDGVVEALELRPGDLVPPNGPVLSLLDISRMWVRAYLPENRLDVQLGDLFAVTVDSYPKRSFTGKVTYISPQAEFTPRNVQTPEERSKQVFRVKVELTDVQKELRAGMAADVWLDRKVSDRKVSDRNVADRKDADPIVSEK
jgi:multidrug resistance efflux pump